MRPGDIYVKRARFKSSDDEPKPILEIWQNILKDKSDFIGYLEDPFVSTVSLELESGNRIIYLLNKTSEWVEEFMGVLINFFGEYILLEDSGKTLSEMGLDLSGLSEYLKESLKSFRFTYYDDTFWSQDKKGYQLIRSSWHLEIAFPLESWYEYLFGRKNEIIEVALNSSIQYLQGIFPVFQDSEFCGLLKHYYYEHA